MSDALSATPTTPTQASVPVPVPDTAISNARVPVPIPVPVPVIPSEFSQPLGDLPELDPFKVPDPVESHSAFAGVGFRSAQLLDHATNLGFTYPPCPPRVFDWPLRTPVWIPLTPEHRAELLVPLRSCPDPNPGIITMLVRGEASVLSLEASGMSGLNVYEACWRAAVERAWTETRADRWTKIRTEISRAISTVYTTIHTLSVRVDDTNETLRKIALGHNKNVQRAGAKEKLSAELATAQAELATCQERRARLETLTREIDAFLCAECEAKTKSIVAQVESRIALGVRTKPASVSWVLEFLMTGPSSHSEAAVSAVMAHFAHDDAFVAFVVSELSRRSGAWVRRWATLVIARLVATVRDPYEQVLLPLRISLPQLVDVVELVRAVFAPSNAPEAVARMAILRDVCVRVLETLAKPENADALVRGVVNASRKKTTAFFAFVAGSGSGSEPGPGASPAALLKRVGIPAALVPWITKGWRAMSSEEKAALLTSAGPAAEAMLYKALAPRNKDAKNRKEAMSANFWREFVSLVPIFKDGEKNRFLADPAFRLANSKVWKTKVPEHGFAAGHVVLEYLELAELNTEYVANSKHIGELIALVDRLAKHDVPARENELANAEAELAKLEIPASAGIHPFLVSVAEQIQDARLVAYRAQQEVIAKARARLDKFQARLDKAKRVLTNEIALKKSLCDKMVKMLQMVQTELKSLTRREGSLARAETFERNTRAVVSSVSSGSKPASGSGSGSGSDVDGWVLVGHWGSAAGDDAGDSDNEEVNDPRPPSDPGLPSLPVSSAVNLAAIASVLSVCETSALVAEIVAKNPGLPVACIPSAVIGTAEVQRALLFALPDAAFLRRLAAITTMIGCAAPNEIKATDGAIAARLDNMSDASVRSFSLAVLVSAREAFKGNAPKIAGAEWRTQVKQARGAYGVSGSSAGLLPSSCAAIDKLIHRRAQMETDAMRAWAANNGNRKLVFAVVSENMVYGGDAFQVPVSSQHSNVNGRMLVNALIGAAEKDKGKIVLASSFARFLLARILNKTRDAAHDKDAAFVVFSPREMSADDLALLDVYNDVYVPGGGAQVFTVLASGTRSAWATSFWRWLDFCTGDKTEAEIALGLSDPRREPTAITAPSLAADLFGRAAHAAKLAELVRSGVARTVQIPWVDSKAAQVPEDDPEDADPEFDRLMGEKKAAPVPENEDMDMDMEEDGELVEADEADEGDPCVPETPLMREEEDL